MFTPLYENYFRLSVSQNLNLYDEAKGIVPDGATEQDGVLEDDGQARPEGLQRQLGDVDVINHNPPCERKEKHDYKVQ